ncbi:T9SS type A sorting domain-containing protein [bacterium]|nr:T9SS type A sorting domain-containing protein [bacterium]
MDARKQIFIGCVLFFAVCGFLLNPGFLSAGQDHWTTSGPDGGAVTGIAVDPGNSLNVVCSFQKGLFRSTNGGETWTRSETGLVSSPNIRCLAMALTDGQCLYCFVSGSGFYRSGDNGQSWTLASDFILSAATELDGIEVSGVNPDLIYAWVGGPSAHVYVSTDRGATFTETGAGLPLDSGRLTCISASLGNSLYAFAGFDDGLGLYRSVDAGENWYRRYGGYPEPLPDPLSILWISNYSNPDKFVRVFLATRNNGVIYTDSYGGRWFKKSDDLPDPCRINHIWCPPGNPLEDDKDDKPHIFAFIETPANEHLVYHADFWYETDPATSWNWTQYSQGIDAMFLAGPSSSPDTLWAGGPDGLRLSTDGGYSWQNQAKGIHLASANSIALCKSKPGLVLAAVAQRTLVTSVDSGRFWQETTALPNMPIKDCLIMPSKPEVFLAATEGGGIYRSSNSGTAWSQISFLSELNYSHIIEAGANTSTYYVLTKAGLVYQSPDAGSTWNNISTGLPSGVFLHALALDTLDPDRMFLAAGFDGICIREADNPWQTVPGWPAGLSALSMVLDPQQLDLIMAGTDQGIYRSQDGGLTWSEAGMRNIPISFVKIFRSNNENSNIIFAGSQNDGVYWAYMDDDTWLVLSSGYPSGNALLDFALDETRQTLFASVEHHGIYAYTFDAYTLNLPNTPIVTAGQSLIIYPNPVRGSKVHIQFYTPDAGEVKIAVLNISGRMAAQITETLTSPGTRVVEFNLGNIANGVYLVCVRQNGKSLGCKKIAVRR